VCPITDIASAQRMGAALTYARRYALFTLVGIAGEDDLDAPDLDAAPNPAAELPRSAPHGKPPGPSARSVLGEQLSASLRESLLQQMAAINSADEAAAWAQRSLPAKNTLNAADAKMVEEQFAARLSAISPPDGTRDGSDRHGTPDDPSPHEPRHAVPDQSVVSGASNTSTRRKATTRAKKHTRCGVIRSLGKTVRLRDKDHRRFVLRQACLICGRVPSDPHHLTFTQPRALGRRASDEFIVPVCRLHHRELHRSGDEAAWWRRLNIDPLPIALRLWQQTRSDEELTSIAQRITQAAAADMPAPDRAGAGLDAGTEAGGSVSENPDRLTRG
jgi:ERF superfamily